MKAFANSSEVQDPYTGDLLELRKVDAKLRYRDDWQKHFTEGDCITPIDKIFKDNGKYPWLRNDDIKNIAKSYDNLETVSRKFNNVIHSRTNEEFMVDDEYLKKTGLKLSSFTSKSLQVLSESNIPGNLITAVMVIGLKQNIYILISQIRGDIIIGLPVGYQSIDFIPVIQ